MQFFSFGPRPGSLILQRSVYSLGGLLLVFTASSFPSWALTATDPQATGEQLETLAREVTFSWAKSHPLVATYLGLSDEDGQLDTPSQAENERDLATIRGWGMGERTRVDTPGGRIAGGVGRRQTASCTAGEL